MVFEGEKMTAVQSRWGFHPCTYESFLLLKKLHGFYWLALRQFAAWQRWARKKPHNRVLRRKIRDEQGRVVGREVVGPMPEPEVCPVFCVKDQVKSYRDDDGNYVREGRLVDTIKFRDHGIPQAYRAARIPVPRAEMVTELQLSVKEIRRLTSAAE